MVGWIIAGSILLLFLILLLSRVTIIVDYDGDIYLKVSYFGITVFKIPSKKKPKKKAKKKKKKSDIADKAAETAIKEDESADKKNGNTDESDKPDDPDKKKKKEKKPKKPLPTFDELMDLLRLALNSVGKPLKKILKRVTFSHLSFDAVCGGADAARAAINYGAMNFALSSVLNLIDTFFTLKAPDDLHIGVDFYQEKTVMKIYCEIRTTVGAAIAFAFSLLGRAVMNYLRSRGARSAIKKLIAKPKEPKKAESAAEN
ncbi:MAG: hypothetical protein K2N56_12280 [Oscillospiraceae bacterium]|nr:hypothetical protein [Oscillospiraceae bacterium]